MVFFGLLMKGMDKIDEQRDAAIDRLILKTTYHGLDGKTSSPGKPSWATVYESLRRNENGRTEEKAWQAKEDQRCAEEASRSGTGTNRNVRRSTHRKA
jgi:hypothetical protein